MRRDRSPLATRYLFGKLPRVPFALAHCTRGYIVCRPWRQETWVPGLLADDSLKDRILTFRRNSKPGRYRFPF
jgi:hypothetical protein